MKCNRYRELIDRMFDTELSTDEKKDLSEHLNDCEICGQHYRTTINYLKIRNILKNNKPVFENKEVFIEEFFENIGDGDRNKEQLITINNFSYQVQRWMSLAATLLILFFVGQQFSDAWQIKQLEARISKPQNKVNYNIVRAGIMLNFLEKDLIENAEIKGYGSDNMNQFKALFKTIDIPEIGLTYKLKQFPGFALRMLSDSNNYSLKLSSHESK